MRSKAFWRSPWDRLERAGRTIRIPKLAPLTASSAVLAVADMTPPDAALFEAFGLPPSLPPLQADEAYAAEATDTAAALSVPRTPEQRQASEQRALAAIGRHKAFLNSGWTHDDPDGPARPLCRVARWQVWG